MAYPSLFSFEDLKKCRSYAAKKRYLERHLEKISQGSSRIVYKVDDEKVIKLAKNAKGLAQNEEEASKGNWDIDIFAEVFDCDPENYWIEMEIARKAKLSDFKRLYGIPFSYIEDFMIYIYKQSGSDCHKYRFLSTSNHDFQKFFEDFIEWEDDNPTEYFKISDKLGYFLKGLYEYIANYSPSYADISDWRRLANWGLVSRNGEDEFVIVDFGINEDIYNSFYKKSPINRHIW